MKLIDTVFTMLSEQYLKELKNIIQEAEELQLQPTSEEYLEKIGKMFGKGYARWLILRMKDKSLKEEDIYKYMNFFKYFEQGRKLGYFTYNDILKYKNPEQFNREATAAHEKLIGFQGEELEDNEKNLISPQQIQTLENVGIKFLGLTPDGYQCFKVPMGVHGNEKAFTAYKNILAQCQGRDKGAKISICTMADMGTFDSYLKDDDFYVFFNMRDPKSPYQFHYASDQFMDKNDVPVA